jgi:hypothetical protein
MHILDEIEYLTTTSQSLELDKVINDPHLHRSFIRSLEVHWRGHEESFQDLKDSHPEI